MFFLGIPQDTSGTGKLNAHLAPFGHLPPLVAHKSVTGDATVQAGWQDVLMIQTDLTVAANLMIDPWPHSLAGQKQFFSTFVLRSLPHNPLNSSF
jgi:hypothetical protein